MKYIYILGCSFSIAILGGIAYEMVIAEGSDPRIIGVGFAMGVLISRLREEL